MVNSLSANAYLVQVESLQKRELIAFEAFYDLYASAFYGEIKRALYKKAESEKALQESFSAMWNSISQFDPSKERLFTWAIKKIRQEMSKQRVNILLQEIFACQHEIVQDVGN